MLISVQANFSIKKNISIIFSLFPPLDVESLSLAFYLTFPWYSKFNPMCPLGMSYSQTTCKFTALKWPFSHFLYK